MGTEESSVEYRERLRDGLLQTALKWGKGIDRMGKPYSWVIDTRELLLQGRYLEYAARLIWEKLAPYGIEVVGGFTLAAHPLAVALLAESRRRGDACDVVLIRREPKEDGLRKQIEGPPISFATRFAVVDDIINSGDTQRAALQVLASQSVVPLVVVTLIDYESAGSAWLREQGIAVESIFTLAELGMAEQACLQPQLAHLKWSFAALNSGHYLCPKSRPAIWQDSLIVGSDQGFAVSLDFRGRENWQFPVRDKLRGVHSTPCVDQERVYFGAYDGFFYALEARTGELVWESQLGQWIGSSPALCPELVLVGVEFGERGGRLLALERETGKVRWKLKANHYIHSAPYFDSPRCQVIVGSNDGSLRAADGRSGLVRWHFQSGGEIKAQAVVDSAGSCFFTSMDGYVYALDSATGRLLWQRSLGGRLYFTPHLFGDTLLVGTQSSRLVALARDSGRICWVATLPGSPVGGAERLGRDLVLLSASDGSAHILNAANGSRLWTYPTQRGMVGGPTVRGNEFYSPLGDGSLCAFELLL